MYSGQTRSMVEYDRQIRYLDYMENGQRSRGAGFVKLERRDGRCNISLQVSGLYRKDHFTRPLLLMSAEDERELCKLQLADGGIKTYLEGLNSHSLDGQGLEYEQLQGLRIPISEGKEIRCLWGSTRMASTVAAPIVESTAESVSGRRDEATAEVAAGQNNEMTAEFVPAWSEERTERPETVRTDEAILPEPVQAVFKEDKWSQLWAIYPHIHPFSDEREYLSFGLSDLVVLSERFYRLVNNSFLLHGYYTHHYLILTRVSQRGGVRYYIGVPGYLFDKEKRIAVMFGFESFECALEPASEGDFGYYMIPVEL